MNIITRDVSSQIESIIADLIKIDGALLPILHRVQEVFGHIPETAKPIIAEALNLSRAEVHGVVTFYPDFRDHPLGKHIIKLCRSEACQAMGCDQLVDYVKSELQVDWNETTKDGKVTLEPVYCLGLCAQSPAAMIDDQLYARLNEHCLSDLLREVRK